MHAHAQVIQNFYDAFAKRDHAAMTACYHDEIHFDDPVFKDLKGWRAKAMWHMLCTRAKDLRIESSNIQADDNSGSAHWEAWYTFSATGNQVHNVVDAKFTFRDGLIIDHKDTFNLYSWSKQALGLKGLLLGWAPPIQNAVRKQASKGLDIFSAKNNLKPS